MISALIDIGSGSIGLALATLERGRVPVIKFSTRKEFRASKTKDSKRLVQDSLATLRLAVGEMQKMGLESPSGIFCFLSSHLTISQTRVIKVNFDTPTALSESQLETLIDSELKRFRSNDGLGKSENSVLIEQKIMKIRLNGYETSDIKGKPCSEAEISVLFTIAPKDVLEEIREAISGSFHNSQVEFHSFNFSYFSVLRDIFQSEQEFIFADIGSEITEVSAVKEGVLIGSVSHPSGKNSIIRRLMEKMGNSEAIAESFISTYAGNLAKGGMDEERGKMVMSTGSTWLDGFKSALEELTKDSKLPEKIFILADGNVSPVFKRLITTLHLSELTLLNDEPAISEISTADLNKFCDSQKTVGDPFNMISAIFINKLLNQ